MQLSLPPVTVSVLALVSILACPSGGGDDEPPRVSAYTWHQDIRPLFARSCLGCHVAGASSGIDLSSPEIASAWAGSIAHMVGTRAMPPWTAAPGCADYEEDFSLTDDEVALIVDWAEGRTPVGDEALAAPLPEPYEPPVLDRVDFTITMPVDYAPTAAPDDYRCFLIDWPYQETAWITGFEVTPGNTAIAHHAIPFLIPARDAESYQRLDDADPGPGYPCYGGPGGTVASLERMRWLGAWAPGGGALLLPEGTGLKVEPGAKIALQMHYHASEADLASPSPPTDRTSVEFRVETTEQGWADMQPWTDITWLLGGMDIPARTNDVVYEFRYTAEDRFAIQSASLHMHQLGRDARFVVERASGGTACLLHEDSWDFNWQRSYRLKAPVIVEPGDTVVLTCTWDNPTDLDVKWGEGTNDEMCLGVTLLTAAP